MIDRRRVNKTLMHQTSIHVMPEDSRASNATRPKFVRASRDHSTKNR